MRKILLLVLASAVILLGIPTEWFTRINANDVNSGATLFFWAIFLIPFICILAIPWLKKIK